jgi:spectinomycin phosphotransferase
MKVKFNIDDSVLSEAVTTRYGLQVKKTCFLPEGDISYAYIVTCEDGSKYFLKLFDKNTETGRERILSSDFYLSATWQMYNEKLCEKICYPIKNLDNSFKTDIGLAVIVLFNFIEGRTLSDDYPFSRFVLEKVAKGMAEVHKTTSKLKLNNIRIEDFNFAFEENLVRMLYELESTSEYSDEYKQALKEYIIPRKKKVLDFLDNLHRYQQSAKNGSKDMVLCHGDMWGGNFILDNSDNLHFIDWEGAVVAPPEYDLRNYLFDDVEFFMEKYREQRGIPVNLDSNLFAFYFHKSHLSNLTNWMFRILYNNQDSEQTQSDLNCIGEHCMDRWVWVDDAVTAVDKIAKV